MLKKMPYISLPKALLLLRISISLVFFTHAMMRVLNGSLDRFGSFLNLKGLLFGTALVWMITAFELIGGILLALGKYTQLVCLGFLVILLMGIILIHFSQGWFVGEHGTGGMEYSFILIMALITVMSGEKQNSH